MNKKLYIAYLGILCLSFVLITNAINQAVIPTSGNIVGSNDIDWTPDSIDWGSLTPGSSNTQIIQIRSNGTQPVTLNYTTANWNPSTAETYLSLSWNYTGTQITQSWTPIAFTLTVSPTVYNITSFEFDIVLTAS